MRTPAGDRFGRLRILGKVPERWRCACDCGLIVDLDAASIRSGATRSCGCLHKDLAAAAKRTHGQSAGRGTPEYRTWRGMLQRCDNPNAVRYPNYGGRGIKVCDRWRSFENFVSDMGEKPGSEYSLDRIENDGDYEPTNCRWATASVQVANRTVSRRLTFGERTQTLNQWAREVGISRELLRERIDTRGWSLERALTTPARAIAPYVRNGKLCACRQPQISRNNAG